MQSDALILRNRGYKGQIILPHRGLATLRSRRNLWLSVVGTAAIYVLWVFILPSVAVLWEAMIRYTFDRLGIDPQLAGIQYDLALVRFTVPYLSFHAPHPTILTIYITGWVTLLMLLGSVLLPKKLAPVRLILGAVGILLASAVLYFGFFPQTFRYNVSDYTQTMLTAGLVFVSMIPIFHLFTYYIFDFHIVKKIALTLLTMLHLCFFVPLQYLSHCWILYEFSLLFMPLLYILFGLFMDILVFVAFYSWGMSWKTQTSKRV